MSWRLKLGTGSVAAAQSSIATSMQIPAMSVLRTAAGPSQLLDPRILDRAAAAALVGPAGCSWRGISFPLVP